MDILDSLLAGLAILCLFDIASKLGRIARALGNYEEDEE